MSIETEIRALPIAEGLDEKHTKIAEQNCQEFREHMQERIAAAALDRQKQKKKDNKQPPLSA